MPAVTAETTLLPRIPAPGVGDAPRPVKSITTAPSAF